MLPNKLKENIKNMDIKEEFKSLLIDLIEAQTFNLRRYYKSFTCDAVKYTQKDDNRVWVKVAFLINLQENKEDKLDGINLFILRPFSDIACHLDYTAQSYRITKTYYLYEL